MRFASRRARHAVGVRLVLTADDHVLLGLRRNTGFADGRWHPPGGGLEAGEPLPAAAIREAREELGIDIAPEDLTFAHLCHHMATDGVARLSVYFRASRWTGEVVNAEPRLCAGIRWFPVSGLPAGMVPAARNAVLDTLAGRPMSLAGWAE